LRLANDLNENEILAWLCEENPENLDKLWQYADKVRKEYVGDDVFLRGLIEISNMCSRNCAYCGIRAGNSKTNRYKMQVDEIIKSAHDAKRFGYGTVVLQSGEDRSTNAFEIAEIVRQIKHETGLAVTLSLGERPFEDYKLWKEAGADRYLLRFETSDPDLFKLIHPSFGSTVSDRFRNLKDLKKLGFEVGSGVMVGIPGQSYETLAHDIWLFGNMELEMVGIGPYISHPETPLGNGEVVLSIPENQVSNSELMTYKAIALTRITCPDINIPATTALATLNKNTGRELGLERGANVVMPNVTPSKYRVLYELYPDKACLNETADECNLCLSARIKSIGRTIGVGSGTSRAMKNRG
jgi:biotin synthase